MLSNRNGTMERDFLPRAKTWKTVGQTRNQDAAHAHMRVTAPLITSHFIAGWQYDPLRHKFQQKCYATQTVPKKWLPMLQGAL